MLHALTQPIVKGVGEIWGGDGDVCGLHGRDGFTGVCIWTPNSSGYTH